MKDGRTHLAHKAEHAVDLETGAIVAVTAAGRGRRRHDDDRRNRDCRGGADRSRASRRHEPQPLEEIIADKGYHSNQTMVDLDAVGIRSYVASRTAGDAIGRRSRRPRRRCMAIVAGFAGRRGRRLMRQRGERIERSFAHLYDTGGMRRTHLRGHTNILKRLLIHAGGFNLGLVMRQLIGLGTPRGLQGRVAAVLATLLVLMRAARRRLAAIRRCVDCLRPCAAGSPHRPRSLSTRQRRRLTPRAVKG